MAAPSSATRRSFALRALRKAQTLLGLAPPGAVSRDAVIWGYRLLLDREPESAAVVEEKLAHARSLDQLRQDFTGSEEFRLKSLPGFCQVALTGSEPPLSIESTTDLEPLFSHIQRAWEGMGESEPYWSVLTSNEYRRERIEETRERFYDTGRINLETFLGTLERNGIDRSGFTSCLEYGCGVGRVTLWLAKTFPSVTGLDISRSHLELARRELEARGAKNVLLRHLARPQDVAELPPVDVVYSVIVLQHNPPPVIAFIVRRMIAALRPGGVAFFQVPTYRAGYRFSLASYLAEDATRQEMEMHLLPQPEIFRIVHEEGARVVEVLEDSWAGLRAGERSNTFLVQRPR